MTRLDKLQRDVLAAFFARESRFVLTGGAALAGFYLKHRTTKDLDLFTTDDRIREEPGGVEGSELHAYLQDLQTRLDALSFLGAKSEE